MRLLCKIVDHGVWVPTRACALDLTIASARSCLSRRRKASVAACTPSLIPIVCARAKELSKFVRATAVSPPIYSADVVSLGYTQGKSDHTYLGQGAHVMKRSHQSGLTYIALLIMHFPG
jgi:hypothetical protein